MIISTNENCNDDEKRELECLDFGCYTIKDNQLNNGEHIKEEKEEESDYREVDHISTVILTLPSRHKDGSIKVKDNSKVSDRKFKTKTNGKYHSAQEIHYVAFYSDCTFDIGSVTQGNHIYLIFKLYRTSSTPFSSKALSNIKNKKKSNEIMNQLQCCLNKIKNNNNNNNNNNYQQPKLILVLYKDYITSGTKLSPSKLSFSLTDEMDTTILYRLECAKNIDPNIIIKTGHLEVLKEATEIDQDNATYQFTLSTLENHSNTIQQETWLNDSSMIFPYQCFEMTNPYSTKRIGDLYKLRYSISVLVLSYNNINSNK